MMAKVRPNAVAPEPAAATSTATTSRGRTTAATEVEPAVAVLTVWRKSLLFNCDGFTVFDARGDLAFRADCYDVSPRRRAEVVLMDAAGTPLLTVRRRARLLAPDRWVIYDGDGASSRPLLSDASASEYVVEGSYGRRGRACAVREARGGAVVAEVRRKADVGDDVFRLVVAGSRLAAPLAMGLVVALDEMFAAARPPPAWSSLRRAWWSA
ncbi:hypothetical protein U9M48_005493 [Paspalum notatum var. saurae]|uniref:Protein LURP-one-related 8 n=1 Tax=Paspalum notatum var. saurae TaxID=547442 RepID=A0AAQ3PXU0_PASNO